MLNLVLGLKRITSMCILYVMVTSYAYRLVLRQLLSEFNFNMKVR